MTADPPQPGSPEPRPSQPAVGRPPPVPPSAPWWQRLGDARLTPGLVVLFFLGLLVLSGLAAGVGLVAHNLRAAITRPR